MRRKVHPIGTCHSQCRAVCADTNEVTTSNWKCSAKKETESSPHEYRRGSIFFNVFMQQFKVCRDGMTDIEIRMYKLQNCYNFFLFMFAGQCVVNVFKQDQQDAKLHNGIYYYKCSTCFRRFLRPSSGAQNCIHNIGYFVELFLLLTAYSEFQLTHDSGKEPPETCTALIVTNVIVLRCVLLVLLQCNKYMLTFLKACILEQN